MRTRVWIFFLVGLAMLFSAAPALAQDGPNGDKVVVGQSFTLPSGERMNGDLAVVGGSVTIEEDATLAGDIAVFGGTVEIAGRVTGTVVAFGGNVELASSAHIGGDLVVLGGTLTRAPGAIVSGDERRARGPTEFFRGPTAPSMPPQAIPNTPVRYLLDILAQTLGAIGLSLVLATLGVLAVVLLPKQTERVAQVLIRQPVVALAAGVLTWLVVLGLGVILAITICLAPLALLLFAVAAVAWLLGWVAAGWLVGQRLLQVFNLKRSSPLLEAIVGVLLITLLWQAIPCLGWLFWFVVSAMGLGAVVLALSSRQSSAGQPNTATMAILPAIPPVSGMPPTPSMPPPPVPPMPWYRDVPPGLMEDMASDAEPPTADDEPSR